MRRAAATTILFVLFAGAGQAQTRGASAPGADSALLQRMLDAEDGRATESSALAPILEGLRSSDIATRRVATRALGRIERRENLPSLQPMLTDPSPVVRAEAFNAIAQIAKADGASDTGANGGATRVWMAVQGLIRGLTASETDPNVRGAMARTLGRLPYPTEDVARAATETIAGMLDGIPTDGALAREPWFGIAHATDDLLRRYPNLRTAPGVLRVAQIPRVPSGAAAAVASDTTWSRETNVILAAIRGRVLGAAAASPNAIDDVTARDVRARFLADFGDADAQVRRQIVASAAVAAALDDSARARLVNAALGDPSQSVRVEAVRGHARRRGSSCGPLVAASRDANAHVALTAIDALVVPCNGTPTVVTRLTALVRELPVRATPRTGARASWHLGAHAIVSLARVAPDTARALLPRLVAHPVWQVRAYAARAAGELADAKTLGTLAQDRSDNVRAAAIVALSAAIRPTPNNAHGPIERSVEIDSLFISELERSDYQVVLEAAKALDGARPSARLGEAAFATFERITAQRKETSRDPRMELLARIEAAGNAAHESRIRPYLNDYDPAIAERVAQVLKKWGIPNAAATPRRPAPLPVSLASLAPLEKARVRITMAPESGGGSFEMRLFVDEAPATISRFVALARRGYYNGLTFHREATNFVIQGGSPGASEYVGNERFMRDELGLRSHERGTLGISTRGRDTGDAQIFVNLIDNWRLDHDYTVFGEIVRGIDVADAVLEGDVIARVEILGAR